MPEISPSLESAEHETYALKHCRLAFSDTYHNPFENVFDSIGIASDNSEILCAFVKLTFSEIAKDSEGFFRKLVDERDGGGVVVGLVKDWNRYILLDAVAAWSAWIYFRGKGWQDSLFNGFEWDARRAIFTRLLYGRSTKVIVHNEGQKLKD